MANTQHQTQEVKSGNTSVDGKELPIAQNQEQMIEPVDSVRQEQRKNKNQDSVLENKHGDIGNLTKPKRNSTQVLERLYTIYKNLK